VSGVASGKRINAQFDRTADAAVSARRQQKGERISGRVGIVEQRRGENRRGVVVHAGKHGVLQRRMPAFAADGKVDAVASEVERAARRSEAHVKICIVRLGLRERAEVRIARHGEGEAVIARGNQRNARSETPTLGGQRRFARRSFGPRQVARGIGAGEIEGQARGLRGGSRGDNGRSKDGYELAGQEYVHSEN